MSFPTTPVFLTTTKGWEQARIHPALAWMEKCTVAWDTRESWSTPWSDWVTDDYTYIKPNGQRFTGGETAWEASKADYSAFKLSYHEPKWVCVAEKVDGWEFVGEATLFIDLPREGGIKKAVDLDGRRWDLGLECMFRFNFVKDWTAKHDGIKIRSMQIYSDSGPVVEEMLRRGIMKPEELLR
ncbi:hypothetical protein BDV33DRAFT_198895 [Aspergillus novoparasiticus]|uniref:SnoaL-like domain-containing protein n=1 Tax=Aspergillus novoparasiticus TaxID=986946 RepID=A0A5N6F5Z1_9EURO|nr:hypothetical protein BDV33DRAFT_198895 [Aspergillus novoparasiticus]